MEDASSVIAKTKIESFRDICFALIAGVTVIACVVSMAGCVTNWVNRPGNPIEKALARCLEQPSLVIETRDPDRQRPAQSISLDAPALFKAKSDAVEKCRTMVFEFYKEPMSGKVLPNG